MNPASMNLTLKNQPDLPSQFNSQNHSQQVSQPQSSNLQLCHHRSMNDVVGSGDRETPSFMDRSKEQL